MSIILEFIAEIVVEIIGGAIVALWCWLTEEQKPEHVAQAKGGTMTAIRWIARVTLVLWLFGAPAAVVYRWQDAWGNSPLRMLLAIAIYFAMPFALKWLADLWRDRVVTPAR